LAISATHVENMIHTQKFFGRQRQDLFFVLGIGSVGEPVNPPLSVFFPQGVFVGAD
jgi:hypothetical protein